VGLFSKKNDAGTIQMSATHISGLEEMFQKNIMVDATWDENKKSVMFKNKIYKVFNKVPKGIVEKTVNLGIDKIKRIGIVSEKEIIERGKSVGGRAVMGALLLGPLGALVGGMSGIGNNKSTKIKMFMVINYDEDKVITLELPLMPLNSNKFTLAVRAHLNAPTEINL
jgi:hypothetical protein